MQYDPRTVARNIPGIFDEIFPQLTPSLVAYFNSSATDIICKPIPYNLLISTTLQRAMLFELGYSIGEQLIEIGKIDWDKCFQAAVNRQSVFYDAKIPNTICDSDKTVAEIVGRNIANILTRLATEADAPLVSKPIIPGLEWISTGQGDFSIGSTLVEIKCTNRRFSAADYRQVAIYWLLSYAASLEAHSTEWSDAILLNPRLGIMVKLNFNNFLNNISSGRTKVEILQIFISLISTRLRH